MELRLRRGQNESCQGQALHGRARHILEGDMKRWAWLITGLAWAAGTMVSGPAAWSQEDHSAALVEAGSREVVPAFVRYSGMLAGHERERIAVRFTIYADAAGRSVLWTETQSVTPDKDGKYAVLLGSSSSSGLPAAVFTDGQARWLGIQVGDGEEQRSLLASVPFAMKAGDAATLAGRSAAEFVTTEQLSAELRAQVAAEVGAQAIAARAQQAQPATTVTNPTGSGVTGYLPLWTAASTLGNSAIFQTGTGSTARAGFGTTTPASTVDVNGVATVRGSLTMQSAPATASAGVNAPPFDIVGSAYSSTAAAAVPQRFRWQVIATGNNTASPSSVMALGYGTTSAAATGLSISSKGIITFAPGQTFPGTGGSTTVVNAASYELGGQAFAYGSAAQSSAFLGFAGNASAAGSTDNTGAGSSALKSLTAGTGNSSYGYASLYGNTAGSSNTASGVQSLSGNTTGNYNTAVGSVSLYYNQTGSTNTAVGASSGPDPGSPNLQNSTAVGAHATVSQSNALVLGQTTAGSPGASYVNVGIGTATPVSPMEISVNAQDKLGPTLTLTNGGGTSGAPGYHPSMASIDFKTYLHASTLNSPTARIEAQDDDYGNYLSFQAKIPESDSNPLVEAFGAMSGPSGATYINNLLSASNYGGFYEGSNPPTVGEFFGDVEVDGVLYADVKNFKIDHPSDPANKYLEHTSVESSEMMNIYSGNVTTDKLGLATVQLPAWFEVENGDFRYQLTTIGRDAHAWVAEEVAGHQFKIATNATFVKVSWQITAVRQDAYAKAHPLVVEVEKPAKERGSYLHPELYGQPEEKRVSWARHPHQMQRMKTQRLAAEAARAKAQAK
jgi:hypothetical protein